MRKTDLKLSFLKAARWLLKPVVSVWAEIEIAIKKAPAANILPADKAMYRDYLLERMDVMGGELLAAKFFEDPDESRKVLAIEYELMQDHLHERLPTEDEITFRSCLENAVFQEVYAKVEYLESLRLSQNRPLKERGQLPPPRPTA